MRQRHTTKRTSTDDLADGMVRGRFGNRLHVEGSEAVTFTPEECEQLLTILFNLQKPLTPEMSDLVRKLAKAKIQALVRKGLGLT